MTDPAVVRQMAVAIDTADVSAVEALLLAHPEAVHFDSMSLGGFAHQAARRGCVAVLDVLHRHGADLDACQKGSSQTPLHVAAAQGQLAACEWLLAHGASVRQASARATPVLAHAVVGRSLPVMQVLLSRGADVNETYGDPPQTALDVALRLGQHDLADWLREQAGAQRAQDRAGADAPEAAAAPVPTPARLCARQWLIDQFGPLQQPDARLSAGACLLHAPAHVNRRFDTCITWAEVPLLAPSGEQVEFALHIRADLPDAHAGTLARWSQVLLQLRAECLKHPDLLSARFAVVAVGAGTAPFTEALLLRSGPLADHTQLALMDVIPLHAAEADWARMHGVPALLAHFEAQRLSALFDPQRTRAVPSPP